MSEVFLEIFQNLSQNFFKWFSKFSDKIHLSRLHIRDTFPLPNSITCNGNLSVCIGKRCACAAPLQLFPSVFRINFQKIGNFYAVLKFSSAFDKIVKNFRNILVESFDIF